MLALALAALGGCSAVRFAYNQAPELVYWWLDRYVDFDDAQAPRVREALAQWFAWHRRSQLPDYARLLARARTEVLVDTTPERACAWWGELRQRAEVALSQALPPAATLIPGLGAQQREQIERRQARTNEEFRNDYFAGDADARRERLVERAVERFEMIYGTLDEAQRRLVAVRVAASPFDAELWFAERRQRQRDAMALLRRLATEPVGLDAAVSALQGYADGLMRSPRPDYRRYAERLERFNCAFAAEVHNTTSAAQRQAAAAKLKGWEVDLRALAAEPQPPPLRPAPPMP